MPLQSRLNKLSTPFDDELTGDMTPDMSSPAGGMAGLDEIRVGQPQPINPNLSQLSPMMQQFSSMMQNYPKPEDYKASKTRRVLAALAGGMAAGSAAQFKDPNAALVGGQISSSMVNKPYDTAVKNWTNKAKALETGAGIEERGQAAQGRIAESQNRIQELQNHNDMLERKYQQESADREAERGRKQEEADRKFAEMDKKLEETKREADARVAQAQAETARKGDATATMAALTEARIAAERANHELTNARLTKQMEDNQRNHDAQIEKMKADAALANERIKLLENPPPKTVTQEEVPAPSFFQRVAPSIFGTPQGKKKVTTTVSGKGGQTTEVPAGAKPGGTWRDTPIGRVYEEP